MSNLKRFLATTAFGILAPVAAAHAGGTDPAAAAGLTALSQLNLIVLGNATGGDDVEGKTFVGGNLSNAATYGNGRAGVVVPASSYATLTVGGNATGNIDINQGANVSGPEGALIGGNAGTVSINGSPAFLTVGGSVGNFNANGDAYSPNAGPTVATGIAATTATLTTDLTSLSTALAALTPTGSVSNTDTNSFTLSATAGAGGYAVIDVTAAELATASNIVYAFSSSTPTIINVTGSPGYSFTDVADNNNGDAYASSVLWNFVGASSIDLQAQEEGGVLAPTAALTNVTDIEGSVAVASFDQGGEVHLGTFTGSPGLTTAVDPAGSPSGVPEPSTWWLLIAGVALPGLVLRRKRVANAAA